ncbi:Rha family transcriptional regulator [Thiocystis violascens]|uniref:Phage regulatory protein, rha family n=1 Tax=Thiocystis violascens (strain ATCC 17096 / DSM 198 / 6111) TaxID=765911 RepID=I3YGU5_THIV6|nr:Rha family transcriptional regulator [Thiocystis violascens]AFL76213.1 phage regulatory protein, rha family [Thiocystis violascens DSM 198]
MSDLILLPASAITLKDGQPVTTSLIVAETFGKQHFHVLRDIDALDCSPEFAKSNFGCADFIDKNGDPRRMFEITRNGFMFLTMGYRGPKPARIKEAYIARFDAMDAQLRQIPTGVGEKTIGLSRYAELLEAENALLRQRLPAPLVSVAPSAPVKPGPRLVTPEEAAEIVDRFTAGESRYAIGKALGRNSKTINRILARANADHAPQMALRLLEGKS